MDKNARIGLDLIGRFNRVLAAKQIALVVVVVPSKIETYAEQLPGGFEVSDYMKRFNDFVQDSLRGDGVQVIDLKKPLRDAAVQNPSLPVFFRLDTHWTPTGAAVAAKAIQEGIQARPNLKKAFDDTPVQGYKLTWASRPRASKVRDITRYLPAGTPEYPPEEILRFQLTKESSTRASRAGEGSAGDISLIGSSFSGDWSGFPDALRSALQRDLVNFSINADVGPWAVMRAYLRDDAFQTKKPKLVIWEFPERSISQVPSYQFRAERYQVDDREWMQQVAALAQGTCEGSSIAAKLDTTGRQRGKSSPADLSTTEGDFVELSFDKPVDHLNYLSARVVADGSNKLTLETYGPEAVGRKFTVDTKGDDLAHALKLPVSLSAKGVTRVRIYPGVAKSFALTDVKVCRYPQEALN
jgi:alginate O-acetyltransferase complex protein AlgJ